jgi:hypothetical protein
MLFGEETVVEGLRSLKKKEQPESFKKILDTLPNEEDEKERCKHYLFYIDRVLEKCLKNDEELTFNHIHLPYHSDVEHEILLNFLVAKFFLRSFHKHEDQNLFELISERKAQIYNLTSRPIDLGEGTRREYNKQRKRKIKLRRASAFLDRIQECAKNAGTGTLRPNTLINALQKDEDMLKNNILEDQHLAMPVDEINEKSLEGFPNICSSVINTKYDRNGIDGNIKFAESPLIDLIDDIIIINAESKNSFSTFNYSELQKLNNNPQNPVNVKNLLVISTQTRNYNLSNLVGKLQRVESDLYKTPRRSGFSSYTILPYEKAFLQGEIRYSSIDVQFIDLGPSYYWERFKELVKEEQDLRELISIKMRNIYSFSFSERVKNYILDQLFNFDIEEPAIISAQTKGFLQDSDSEFLKDAKNYLKGLLDEIKESNLLSEINRNTSSSSFLLVPSFIKQEATLLNTLISQLTSVGRRSFITWETIRDEHKDSLVILDYRDTGRYPFRIHPNIHELIRHEDQKVKGIFIKEFFERNYKRTYYDYSTTLFNTVLSHSYRSDLIDFENLRGELEDLKDAFSEENPIDTDNDYLHQNRETICVYYPENKTKRYSIYQQFIVKDPLSGDFSVIDGEELFSRVQDKPLLLQPIEDAYQGINLFRRTENENQKLQHVKEKFSIDEDLADEQLWKQLLSDKRKEIGSEKVYIDLREKIGTKGGRMVSKHTLREEWLDPESQTLVPRSKKVFKAICDYLDLPSEYFRVIQKLKAERRGEARESTRKMNKLIADLVNRGYFNADINEDEWSRLSKEHDLEEIGIDLDHGEEELNTLVSLVKGNLSFSETRKAEKNE